jgi:CRISPR-associated protein Cmr4
LELAGEQDLPTAPASLADDMAHAATGTSLLEEKRIYLEDIDFTAQECPTATAWAETIARWVFPDDQAWQQQFKQRFVVVSNVAFDFICETGTEVHSRVKIDPGTKTVANGALWTEESLPTETILAGLVQCDRVFGRDGEEVSSPGLLKRFASDPLALQIGGKATVGRGQVRCIFTPVGGNGQ